MIKSKLKQIASKENGIYSCNEYTRIFSDGSRCPEIEHKIQFSYMDCVIEIYINMGFLDVANINCILSSSIKPVHFKVLSISPFVNLFLRRNSRFRVKCKNKRFKYFLENNALPIFDEVVGEKNFTPNIISKKDGLSNKIIMEFHIVFPDWVDVFEGVVVFFKAVIDELKIQ